MADANILPCSDFCACSESHRAISGSREMRYFTSVSSCKLERSSLHFSFEKLSPVFTRMWKSWKSETANCSYVLPVFAPIHLPEATGICKWGKDKKSHNKRPGLKESSHERALLRKGKKSQNQTENILKVYDLVKCCNLREAPQWSRGVRQFQTEEGRRTEEDMRDGKSPQLQHILCFSTFEKVFRWCKQSQPLLDVEEAGRSLDQFDCSSVTPNGLEQVCIMTNGQFKGFRGRSVSSQPVLNHIPIAARCLTGHCTCYTHDRNWTGFNLLF